MGKAKGRLAAVPVPAGATGHSGWFDPRTLDDHPDNWKEHPPEQAEVIGELIDSHGWLAPLTVNRRTGRLLNGHERKRIAVEKGLPAVPVWVVDVPEEAEADIVATLDTSGSMARANAAKVAAIMDRMRPQSAALAAMMERLAKQSGATAHRTPPEFLVETADGADGLAPASGGSRAPAPLETYQPPPSAARMVNLFLTTETAPQFLAWVERLGEEYGTGNTTDTVYEAVRRAANPA